MDKARKRRWVILLSALAGTIGAIVYPTDETMETAPANIMATRPVSAETKKEAQIAADSSWIATDLDPFASKGWVAAPVAPAPLKVNSIPQSDPEPPPIPPPPLPYQFVGQMNNGADRVVYLGRGDQVVLARVGDILESSYKVVTISATHIDFESLSSGLKQSLPIPARDN